MSKHIGIYTGTFDPIHQGHLAFSEAALKTCALDEVVFIPEKTPRGKPLATAHATRIAGATQAVRHHPSLRVTALSSHQFSVNETLPELQRLFERAELTFLFGSDIARTFTHGWDNLDQLLTQASLAIGMREDDTVDELERIMEQLEQQYTVAVRRTYIHTSHAHMSSTKVRAKLPA